MSYADLSRAQLAKLVPELLLSGQLIDRSGMAHCIAAFGRETMAQIAIEEWMAASPVYTGRMRTALQIDGDGVADMFKCLQLDIGAPPQFMDFRYTIFDKYHGEFVLNHCGALMDVEPMGDDYVTSMCHDIEDPTFDATAIATNRRARIRPIHRPPRRPADQHPHCAWTVTIEPDREELPLPPESIEMSKTQAAKIELSPIDPESEGHGDYIGPVWEDLRFEDWSHSALVRIAEEVALQHHLLALGFLMSVRGKTDEDKAAEIFRKQLTGISGLTADRLRKCLGLGQGAEDLAAVLRVHPILGPDQYAGTEVSVHGTGESAIVRLRIPADSSAVADGGWLAHIDPDHLEPVLAMATGVDLTWSAVTGYRDGGDVVVEIAHAEAIKELSEVAIARFSGGSTFEFADRGIPLSITPVNTGA
ncbi:hypothetical protein [Williamsia muralis]|uniref:hypothetical protein n=1 Tax=Williamsia marianensis TaxID=85044 RepID=UPI000DE72088|nr:hypothetical protein [Williamsia marianensis]PVY28026.1 hypothetical protein C7458_10967 [Williamsia marianensis]